MSCVFCKYYNGLFLDCDKGTMIRNLSESFDCNDFVVNDDYDGKDLH